MARRLKMSLDRKIADYPEYDSWGFAIIAKCVRQLAIEREAIASGEACFIPPDGYDNFAFQDQASLLGRR